MSSPARHRARLQEDPRLAPAAAGLPSAPLRFSQPQPAGRRAAARFREEREAERSRWVPGSPVGGGGSPRCALVRIKSRRPPGSIPSGGTWGRVKRTAGNGESRAGSDDGDPVPAGQVNRQVAKDQRGEEVLLPTIGEQVHIELQTQGRGLGTEGGAEVGAPPFSACLPCKVVPEVVMLPRRRLGPCGRLFALPGALERAPLSLPRISSLPGPGVAPRFPSPSLRCLEVAGGDAPRASSGLRPAEACSVGQRQPQPRDSD